MSSSSLNALVAHYLAQHYPLVLPPFLGASGTPPPDLSNPPIPDLATVVADAASAALAQKLAATTLAAGIEGESLADLVKAPLPPTATLGAVIRSVEDVSAANLLAVKVATLPRRTFDTASASYRAEWVKSIVAASADKAIRVIDYATGEVTSLLELHKAPALTFAVHPTNGRYLASGSMDGSTVLSDLVTGAALQRFQAGKFVVRVAFSADGRWLAAASYDKSVTVFEAVGSAHAPPPSEDDVPLDEGDDADLAAEPGLRYEERYKVQTEGNPEAMVFHPRGEWLLFTVRGSHELQYLRLPGADAASTPPWTIVTKSFNPHPLDTHVSFAVLDLALHPSGRLLACLTGDHAGPAKERVLLYGVEPDETERLACLWTGSEGDDYVLPRLAWLPDGTGIVTTTPTGHLHLLSLGGEKRATLKAHGSRGAGTGTTDVVRDLDVSPTADGGYEVVSVGYDRRVQISR
ncbi:hypothetical protein VHUM_04111 [Vanrija humicola]|uniref:Uncharacterized protein n=1 Tax=Vanrija humicola TaxID=5417 RepID=A0A7D8YVM6_VANHU|nr:hypothetical protein VHUM_04111 [Vanrija humicola]